MKPFNEQPRFPLAQAALRGSAVELRLLDDLADDLEREVFGDQPLVEDEVPQVSPEDHRLTAFLDVLGALAILEPDEFAHAWRLGRVHRVVGRPLQAACVYLLEAAPRSARLAASGEGLADESDWTESCFDHATGRFTDAGHVLSASLLLGRLTDGDRRERAAALEEAADALPRTAACRLALDVVRGAPVDAALLERSKRDLFLRAFGGGPALDAAPVVDAAWRDPQLVGLLDTMAALARLRPDDVRPSAELATVLGALGLHLEAAQIELSDAALRAAGPDHCRARAAQHLALEGHVLSAAVVLATLDGAGRSQAEPVLTDALAHPGVVPRRRHQLDDPADSYPTGIARWALAV